MKKKILALFVAAAAMLGTGCENWLNVNKNNDAPDRIDAHLYLPGIIQNYYYIYYVNHVYAPLTQMMGTGSSAYQNYALHGYPSGSDNGAYTWNLVYWKQGMNLENLINQSVAAQEWTMAGIGYAIKAFSWDMLTKCHGDVILDQAFEPGRLSHDFDSQAKVYDSVHTWALRAIEYLEREDKTAYSTRISANDYMFKGDKAKWIKFCYSVLIRQLISLTNKNDFATKYGPELVSYADKAILSPADNATFEVSGKGGNEPFSSYNNFYGTYRGNLSRTYFQHEWAVQVFTGTVPEYDPASGDKIELPDENDERYKFQLAKNQIICDTNVTAQGHYDPRVVVKLGTTSDNLFQNTGNLDSIKRHEFYGGSITSTSGPLGSAPSIYGREAGSSTVYDGPGRWIYRDDAPYILITSAEIKFCIAEAYFRMGNKSEALRYWKEAIADDMTFTAEYIKTGSPALSTKEVKGGDKITQALFREAAAEYLAGPFVEGITASDLTLSHIMMQKFVALYPWGAISTWVDQRKVFYDVEFTGEYPYNGNGWNSEEVQQKWDTDPTKVYKGYYLYPANVTNRRSRYSLTKNLEGAPCFRIRPLYNSEYMWNEQSLMAIKPIPGTADYYQCSIPWFCYPADMPQTYPDAQ